MDDIYLLLADTRHVLLCSKKKYILFIYWKKRKFCLFINFFILMLADKQYFEFFR